MVSKIYNTLITLIILKLVYGIEITPTSNDEFATVSFTEDARTNPTYINGIVDNNWQINDDISNTLNDWYVSFHQNHNYKISLLSL